MKCHLMSLEWKVHAIAEKEYKIKYHLPIDILELEKYEVNEKSINSILSGLTNSIFVKFM